MPRLLLDEAHVHPTIRGFVADYHRSVIDEVRAAMGEHPVVVVGMAMNPWPKKAMRALSKAGIAAHYLEYGSYLGDWRRRNALKMWSGWPTFPMVFVKGILVGGAQDLDKLVASGELKRLLG